MKTKMARWIASCVLIALTLALGAYAVIDRLVGASQVTDSGIQGTTWIGPVSPVQKEGESNEKAYPDATILVVDAAGKTVATIVSGKDGSFRAALEPGTYVLEPQSPDGAMLPRGIETTVVVAKGRFTEVDVHYDSGIR
jgi:hypothetical protein